MSQCTMSAPWADTMETEREGHGGGEGTPIDPPGSDTWTVYDWDRYDLDTLLHAHIMVHYELLAYTSIARRVVRNHAAHDAVMESLQCGLDRLVRIRDDVREGSLF